MPAGSQRHRPPPKNGGAAVRASAEASTREDRASASVERRGEEGEARATTRTTSDEMKDPGKGQTTGKLRRRRSGRLLQLYAPRLPVLSSAFVFGVFTLLVPVLDRAYHRISDNDGRVLSDVPTAGYDLGRFQVKWEMADLQVKVRGRRCRTKRARGDDERRHDPTSRDAIAVSRTGS